MQMTIIFTTVGKNPLEGMEGVALSQQEFEMQYLVVVSKTIISVQFQGKPYNVTIIQVYVPITNAEKAEVGQF